MNLHVRKQSSVKCREQIVARSALNELSERLMMPINFLLQSLCFFTIGSLWKVNPLFRPFVAGQPTIQQLDPGISYLLIDLIQKMFCSNCSSH